MKIPMKVKLLALILVMAAPVMAQTVAIRAGHVIDTAAGTVTKDQIILVEGGKIKSIGSNVGVPKDAQMVDLSGEWLTPGLIDAHTHITMTEVPGKAPFEALYLKESSAFRGLRGLKNAQEMLQAGFTAVRDVGNEANYACEDVRKAVQKRWFEGPTILCAGKIIGPFGGQSEGMPEEQGAFWRWEYLDADTPDEIRKAIHENLYYGADVIKLASDNSEFFYTEDEIRAAVENPTMPGARWRCTCTEARRRTT